MADTKISALTQLTGAGSTADADELILVDKSDTTTAPADAAGSNKRITIADLSLAVHERPVPEFTTTSPASPTAGLLLFTRKRAGRYNLGGIGPTGIDHLAQPAFWNNTVNFLRPQGNGTTLTAVGLTATAIGTATAANWANTSLLASLKRLSYISAATAGASGGVKHNVLQWWRGNAAGLGGFFFSCRFGFATIPATRRWFVGMFGSTTNPANADPSTFVNMIGVGQDVGDTTIQIMHNDGTGTATKTNTTLASPAANEVWEARVYCDPNASKVGVSIERLNTSSIYDYDSGVSVDLPANTAGLLPILWANNDTTAAAINPVLVNMYLETDY